jgi:hypothetical protein
VLRGLSLLDVSKAVNEDYAAIWRVVNYERPGPRIRKKLCRKYRGLKFDPLTERKAA